ncbi:DUF350 domain-containing protein [Brenneria tiliae]|uniref:DUF350 domain-containing protein n=1 Tax=Brenneria tiliae TaxID=2914984 RepID=A0ABT0MVT0_9GAMM|nr:DUF350 domain-containing protein [Brenneria tiliae]MCL2893964.1 DUF350 domain-containing protein [Brenneria tiliae]MCL2896474.1 DUF350 domain-containing protein [Brenneria tiliae]MCL2900997.1 DUF350 domain-containing protein [Brenneria tiliae]
MIIVSALLAFASYFFIGFVMVLAFLFIYTRVTPHDEWTLIKQNNGAAAVGFAGALIGYVIPLASAAVNSVSLVDYITWGIVALVIQLVIYGAVRLYMPAISQRIQHNEVASGVFLCTASLGGGILNAACMTY